MFLTQSTTTDELPQLRHTRNTMASITTCTWLLVMFVCGVGQANMPSNEHKLHYYITQANKYNKNIRPEGDSPMGALTVKLSIRLSQILDVSEKHQIFASSMWLRHEWTDPRLRWDPSDVGGLNHTYLPSKDLWIPDIILYNNADGAFVIEMMTKATVYYTGRIEWVPPAIYKSYCPINVEFFPFDQQECFMKFGSWTNDIHAIDLRHEMEHITGITGNNETFIPYGIDLCSYKQNGEWDLINVTAKRKNKIYPCCQNNPYPYLMFNVTIRRRTLFYTVNLILPIIAISTITVLVFYLPSASRAKLALTMSILVALTVFFLLLSDLNPPTSLVIPLIAKYLLFTMIVITMSIFLTVYTLSIHVRNPATHTMSPWVKKVFTNILPKILGMQRPPMNERFVPELQVAAGRPARAARQHVEAPYYENLRQRLRPPAVPSEEAPDVLKESIAGVNFIANHLRKEERDKQVDMDWNYVAMIMDRIFLYIFTLSAFIGTAGIFLNAPTLYDDRGPLKGINCTK